MRSRSSAVLLALAVIVLASSLGAAQYAPKWHVGDWWVVKTWQESRSAMPPFWVWRYTRYGVVRIEKAGKHDCFVLEVRYQGPSGEAFDPPQVFYVRTDSWLVVRQVTTLTSQGTTRKVTEDSPLGLAGPFPSEPRLPHFPLRLASSDTAFSLKRLDHYSASLREISEVADSALVNRMLNEGDTAGGRILRPTGVVYQVRNELGGNLEPDPYGGEKRIEQSLQFWSNDQPWRVYEELVQYDGPKPVRRVVERTWLVAVGHKGK